MPRWPRGEGTRAVGRTLFITLFLLEHQLQGGGQCRSVIIVDCFPWSEGLCEDGGRDGSTWAVTVGSVLRSASR